VVRTRIALICAIALGCQAAIATPLNCFGVEFQGKAASVCKADVRNNQLRLFLRDDKGEVLGSLDAAARLAAAQGERLQFAMNAGMYHPDFAPVGLLVIDGREVSPLNLAEGEGNFFLKPNGIFLLSTAGVRIVAADQYARLAERVMLATQSGPLLLGTPAPRPLQQVARNSQWRGRARPQSGHLRHQRTAAEPVRIRNAVSRPTAMQRCAVFGWWYSLEPVVR
jgi:uncharacterized protein YigE (DUF2233 family)